jgi:Ca-activated chloride channel family protein
LELRPDWEAALINRKIASARANRVKQEGGDMGDQKLGADEIRFDKNKKSEGQDTDTESATPMSSEAMQALWLRRVQTKPADFMRAKFAYQLSSDSAETDVDQ